MLSEPRIEQRDAQPYAAIRSRVLMAQLAADLPGQVPEVFDWLAAQGTTPAGAPFFRYLAMHEDGSLDVDVGVPVAAAITADHQVIAAVMPAGQYAVTMYTGPYDGISAATHEFHNWVTGHGYTWGFQAGNPPLGAHVEWYITDPATEAAIDPALYLTELAVLVG